MNLSVDMTLTKIDYECLISLVLAESKKKKRLLDNAMLGNRWRYTGAVAYLEKLADKLQREAFVAS